MLVATLDVDDFVDLEELRVAPQHPAFEPGELEVPTPAPELVTAPTEPVYREPEAPKGLGGVFGKKKHAAAVAAAQEWFEAAHAKWSEEAAAVPARQLEQMQAHDAAEKRRRQALQWARDAYERACAEREAEASEANQALDSLIAGLAAGEEAAIQEYIGIVLSNSVYPEVFPVEYDFEFDSSLKELVLTAIVPPPSTLPRFVATST